MASSFCKDTNAVGFVRKHRADAERLATMVNVPFEFILGLAASETGWGIGRFALYYNNFFSMHAQAPDKLPKYATGAVIANGTINTAHPVYVATYGSFYACGMSFLDKFGKFIFGAATPERFAAALQGGHFNPGTAEQGGNPKFVSDLIKIIPAAKARLACPV